MKFMSRCFRMMSAVQYHAGLHFVMFWVALLLSWVGLTLTIRRTIRISQRNFLVYFVDAPFLLQILPMMKSFIFKSHLPAYEIIGTDYCLQAFKTKNQTSKLISGRRLCIENDCSNFTDTKEICSLRNDRGGFRVRLFESECQLRKYNCEYEVNFTVTNLHICNGMQLPKRTSVVGDSSDANNDDIVARYVATDNLTVTEDTPTDNDNGNPDKYNANNETNIDNTDKEIEIININKDDLTKNEDQYKKSNKINNVIVVRSSLIDFSRINESVRHFFAATHVFDLPVKEVDRTFLNESTRRRLIKIAGPIKVFVPWVTIPKNISDDFDHRPTLSTCYHKCPRKCPSTYAPVCGVPGIVAREPSLMFQNHCFMDVAQCKMYWENKSPTSLSSSYVESSFLFCLGDEMNGMYRFLPLVRTLQHMGRLRKKGRFYYRFKNFKFFNNLLARQPKFMG